MEMIFKNLLKTIKSASGESILHYFHFLIIKLNYLDLGNET